MDGPDIPSFEVLAPSVVRPFRDLVEARCRFLFDEPRKGGCVGNLTNGLGAFCEEEPVKWVRKVCRTRRISLARTPRALGLRRPQFGSMVGFKNGSELLICCRKDFSVLWKNKRTIERTMEPRDLGWSIAAMIPT